MGRMPQTMHSIGRGTVIALAATLLQALAAPTARAAQSGPLASAPAPRDSHALQQVQVTASKLDRHTLRRVAIQFVKLHGAVSPVIHQIGRWRADVCPKVTGLRPAGSAYVSRHVEEVAQSVGAPVRGIGKRCTVNVEIIFTPVPQAMLDHIAKAYPALLGSSRSAGDTSFRHAIQSWYLTGTRAVNSAFQSFRGFTGSNSGTNTHQSFIPSSLVGVQVDPAYGQGFAPIGLAGSYFTKGLTSEILHVLVIVDTRKVAGDSLRSISDYIAMLALTRMGSLEGCNELPSIIDLLSSGCGEREKPQTLTDADTAYLKALYSSDLEANLNIEEGDMRDRMVTAITGR